MAAHLLFVSVRSFHFWEVQTVEIRIMELAITFRWLQKREKILRQNIGKPF
jgi:hypothetical protein